MSRHARQHSSADALSQQYRECSDNKVLSTPIVLAALLDQGYSFGFEATLACTAFKSI